MGKLQAIFHLVTQWKNKWPETRKSASANNNDWDRSYLNSITHFGLCYQIYRNSSTKLIVVVALLMMMMLLLMMLLLLLMLLLFLMMMLLLLLLLGFCCSCYRCSCCSCWCCCCCCCCCFCYFWDFYHLINLLSNHCILFQRFPLHVWICLTEWTYTKNSDCSVTVNTFLCLIILEFWI